MSRERDTETDQPESSKVSECSERREATAQCMTLADIIVDACTAAAADPHDGKLKKVAVRSVADALAAIHERAVACAVVRVEREFNVKERKR